MRTIFAYFVVYGFLWAIPAEVYAEYTPLVTSSDFVGIKTDVTTVAVGVVGIMIVVVGLAMLVRALRG